METVDILLAWSGFGLFVFSVLITFWSRLNWWRMLIVVLLGPIALTVALMALVVQIGLDHGDGGDVGGS